MSTRFTWQPKVTAVLSRCPEEHRNKLLWALVRYGTDGDEPQFDDWQLQTIFMAVKDGIKRQGVS